LPEGLDTIHVDNFRNEIDPAKEVSNSRATYTYQPGLEVDITREVIDQFIKYRHLRIESEKNADLILKGALVDYKRYPLSYSEDDDIEEYRIEIIVSLELYDQKNDKLMWKEDGFMGESTYPVTGPNRLIESQAIDKAVEDLSLRIVERVTENW
jgi:hypothetical protein